jgi:hypothetical protein
MHTLRSLRMWASLTRRGQGDSGLPVLSPDQGAPLVSKCSARGKARRRSVVPGHTASFLPLDYSRKVFFKDLVMNRSALMKHDGDSCLPRRTPRVNLSFNISPLQPAGGCKNRFQIVRGVLGLRDFDRVTTPLHCGASPIKCR